MTSIREYWNKYYWLRGKEQNRQINMQFQRVDMYRAFGPRTLPITTKPPLNDPDHKWGIDIAGVWDGIIDGELFRNYGGDFVIVKALDGTITGKFLYENAAQIQNAQVGFGEYCWLYPDNCVSTKAQGQRAAQIANETEPSIVFFDFEWTMFGGKSANPNESDLLNAVYWLHQGWDGPIGVYSSLGYTSEHPLSVKSKDLLWWAAQYGVLGPSPVNPFGINWVMWQQSDRWGSAPPPYASEWGINPDWSHAVDGDLMPNAAYYSIFTGTTPPPPPPSSDDVITSPYAGVVVTTGRRFDSDFRMTEVAPSSIVDEHFTAPGKAHIVENIPGDIVVNGGDFNMTTYQAVGLLRSEGAQYSPQVDFEPALAMDAQRNAVIDHQVKDSWVNALALKRYIVIDGAVSPNTSIAHSIIENREVAWDNLEPRTIYGLRKDGTRLLLQVKGRQPDQAGITLYQAADIMIEFGADRAGDGDGGDSVQGKVGSDLFIGTAQRRLVADFLTITVQKEDPVAYRYSSVSDVNNMSLRFEHNVASARKGDPWPLNTVMQGSEIWIAPADGLNVKAGDTWLHVLLAGTTVVDGWMAIIHLGKQYMVLTDHGAPPPPPGDDYILRSVQVVLGVKQPDGTYKDYTFNA